ncbi:MAG: endonuclease III [Lachnospiraceae bacterium]|nr:endonuclease III [Lachnospiraceae bacterium]
MALSKKQRVTEVLKRLDEQYGTGQIIYLKSQSVWQLLVAVMLSAQCTDDRVNMTTPALFAKYPTVQDMADADIKDVEELIHSVGLYRSKAANIVAASRKIVDEFGGEVPRTLEELTSLPGVGRKTANVIRGNVFDDPSIVVDTHVNRISGKLGFTKNNEPEKVEQDLMKVLPKDHWIRYNMQIITLGRTICTARSPRCTDCFLSDVCPAAAAGKESTGKRRRQIENKK